MVPEPPSMRADAPDEYPGPQLAKRARRDPALSLFARLEIVNRVISAFLEHGVDPLHDQIVNLDPFVKSDLA
jgi:hypothetical protein